MRRDKIPQELRHLPQWVLWKIATPKGSTRTTKVPFQLSGKRADTTDSTTWNTFDRTLDRAEGNGKYEGIGFVFSPADEYAGIDLDNCLNPDGTVKDWAAAILAKFTDTYSEISPSGRGIKIWVRGKLPQGRKIEFEIGGEKCGVEAYSQGRYFTLTGLRWHNAPLRITPHQSDIEAALEIASALAKKAEPVQPVDGQPIAEGGRHEALKRLAIKLRSSTDLGEDEVTETLLAYNRLRCKPAKPEQEIRDIVAWVMAHRFDGGVDPATLPKLVGVDGETIYAAAVEDLKPVVEGFLYPGCTVFSGRPKSGKSWLMLQAALGVASESPIAGRMHVCQPGRVLYLALEESEARTTRRMRKLTPASEFLRDITFIYRKDIEAAANGGVLQIEEYLKTHPGVRLVVIDTLLAFQRVERKKTNDLLLSDYNMIQPLQDLAAKYDCAIVIVDHSRKLAGDAIDVVSGSTGKTAAPDAIVVLKRQTDGSSLLTVIPRDGEEQVYQMKLYDGGDGEHSFGWSIVAMGDDATNSAESQEVIELLRELPLSPKEIARQLGRKEGTIRMRLKRLVERGRIRFDDRDGKYHPL